MTAGALAVGGPNHLTITAVAERLGWSTGKVRALIRSGELTGVKSGRQQQIPEAAVAEYLTRDARREDEWLRKHLARSPDRDEEWVRRALVLQGRR